MRLYGKDETGFWTNPKVADLSTTAKLLLVYLYSSPHSSSFGCFVLKEGYVQADLSLSPKTISKALSELFRKGFVRVDKASQLLWIAGWWGHNTISNPNVALNIVKQIRALPKCELKNEFVADLLGHSGLTDKVLETLSKGLSKPFAKPFAN